MTTFPVQIEFERGPDGRWSALASSLDLIVMGHDSLESALEEIEIGILNVFTEEFHPKDTVNSSIPSIRGSAEILLHTKEELDIPGHGTGFGPGASDEFTGGRS